MSAPRATALDAAPSRLSRFSGRPVSTRSDGLPAWFPRAASPATPPAPEALPAPTDAFEAGIGNGEGGHAD